MAYRLSGSTGSVNLCAEGKEQKQTFIDGARGLFSLMFDIDRIRDEQRSKIVVQAKNLSALYAAWLSELLSRHEIDKIVFSEFSVSSIQEADKEFLLTGAAYGETYDAKKHIRKGTVKGVPAKGAACAPQGGLIVCRVDVNVT